MLFFTVMGSIADLSAITRFCCAVVMKMRQKLREMQAF
ncbi:hypothetical protein A4U88_2712 [Serratia marcescens]|nr:hypothetical protein A4U88_2712 [Serratia marcescens]AXK22984.1 Hypothetical protein SmN45_1186 [Serratia marcescens]